MTRSLPLYVFFCSGFLFQAFSSQNAKDTPECSGLSPDDENDDGIFATFSEKLMFYTGMSSTEKYSVTLPGCEGRICVVNPNGTAIWDARMDFYMGHMSRNLPNDTDPKTTLDGCLCYSQTVPEYQSCMTVIRQTMIDQLETVLAKRFKTILENDCTLYTENCV